MIYVKVINTMYTSLKYNEYISNVIYSNSSIVGYRLHLQIYKMIDINENKSGYPI